MLGNVKKYCRQNAGPLLSDSSDEEEFFFRGLKNQVNTNTNDTLNSKNVFRGSSKKNKYREKFYERNSTDNTLKATEIFKEMTRKNIEGFSAKVRAHVSRQISELADVKKKYIHSLNDELNRWKKYSDLLKCEEDKFLKVLQILKNKHYLIRAENKKFGRIFEIYKTFIKEHGEIMNKYEAEVNALKNFTIKEISDTEDKLLRKCYVTK